MSEVFTASNGVTVAQNDGSTYTMQVGSVPLKTAEFDALREFFQHERDAELGLWRWPENPDIVVYPLDEDGDHPIFNEGNGQVGYVRGRSFERLHDSDWWKEVARDYFTAHPHPKPWHQAEAGDIWLITFRGFEGAEPWGVRREPSGNLFAFPPNGNTEPVTSDEIENATRIWPEGDK